MGRLHVVERHIDGPEPVQRTLLLDDEPVAVAFIDPRKQEVTLVWVIEHGTSLGNILDVFFFTFLARETHHRLRRNGFRQDHPAAEDLPGTGTRAKRLDRPHAAAPYCRLVDGQA